MTEADATKWKQTYVYGLPHERLSMTFLPANDHDNGWEPSLGVGGAELGVPPKTLWYLTDALGSTLSLLEKDGRKSVSYHYDEFGIPLDDKKFDVNWPGPDNLFGYTGLGYDYYSELTYARARYYQPEIGRFISEDPYKGDLWNPQSQNRFTYVGNNPVLYIDPSGFAACKKDCDYTVYLVAGIQTTDDFFSDLKKEVIDRYDKAGKDVYVKIIYPYGDASRDADKQMKDVGHDAHLDENKAQSSIGGKIVRKQAKQYFAGGEMVFIGHSGGGVASYHGAKVLEVIDEYKVKHVVQVGSPMVRISPSFKNKVTSIYKIGDPIPQTIGQSYGQVGNNFLTFKNLEPGTKKTVDIVKKNWNDNLGGHMDYFDSTLTDKKGVTNLDKTMNIIWESIKP